MAEVFRPTYTTTDPQTGEKVKKQSKTWHVRYYTPDGVRHRVKGYRGKKATKNLAGELERRAQRMAAGLTDPAAEHGKRPLAEHLADFSADLKAKGCTGKQVLLKIGRIRRLLDGCGFIRMADLDAARVQSYLADLRAAGRSIQTSNYYLREVRALCLWLVRNRRMTINPLAHLQPGNAKTDPRHHRRPLACNELAGVIAAAESNRKLFRNLTGPERAMLYRLASGSGFRAGELASLTPSSFDLAGDCPTVTLAAKSAKNGRLAVQPLSPALALVLRPFLAGKDPAAPVWPGSWYLRAAKMFCIDLAQARKQWLSGVQDARKRAEAEQGDYLAYCDSQGCYIDFHSLRHTFISLLDRSGATLKEAMQLARHSDPKLTTAVYGRAQLHDLSEAVRRLPDFPTSAFEPLAATGTTGKTLGPFLGPQPAISGDFLRQGETEQGSVDIGMSQQKTLEIMRNSHDFQGPESSSGGWDRTTDTRLMKPLL